jgi:aryl-alcohol dehydrogenase-like predicted oxidoreductase
MQGFPPVEQEAGEPAFHVDREAHVFALNLALIGRDVYNLDEFRDAVESIATIRGAHELGVTFFSTAELYARGAGDRFVSGPGEERAA